MAFDMGWNFRATSGFVTDPAYGVPVLGEAYPHTYTNGNGYSINAGWVSGAIATILDRSNTNDPRIAGINYVLTADTFKADLNSGSAPGAGTYNADCAVGDQGSSQTQTFQLLDTSTVLIDGSAGLSTANQHFRDATLADVSASTSWTGTPLQVSFATTIANFLIGISTPTTLAHFRLTLAGAAQSVVPVLMAQYRQRGA